MIRIKNNRDFLAGLLLIGFGLAALTLSFDYPMGTMRRMGPGYFPVVLSGLLILIGIIVALSGAVFTAKDPEFPRFAWRALLVVTVAVTVFGLIIDGMGLLATTAVMVVISRFSRPEYRYGETFILAVLISIGCAAVFYLGLRVQMPLLPKGWG